MYDPTKFIGSATCACGILSRNGDPCEHDIALLLEGLKANPRVKLQGVDDTGKETWEDTLASFVYDNRDMPEVFIPVLSLKIGQTVRLGGCAGSYVDVTCVW